MPEVIKRSYEDGFGASCLLFPLQHARRVSYNSKYSGTMEFHSAAGPRIDQRGSERVVGG